MKWILAVKIPIGLTLSHSEEFHIFVVSQDSKEMLRPFRPVRPLLHGKFNSQSQMWLIPSIGSSFLEWMLLREAYIIPKVLGQNCFKRTGYRTVKSVGHVVTADTFFLSILLALITWPSNVTWLTFLLWHKLASLASRPTPASPASHDSQEVWDLGE